jgi:heme/copper-type cytochrome/quinol oxidase subunit 3
VSHAVASHGGGAAHATSTGLTHNKLMMWAFLASDCMFFGTLIMTYMVYRGRSLEGPYPEDTFSIPYTSVSAAVLLISSLAMVLALAGIQQNKHRQFRAWLTATALLGTLFLGGQYFEFTDFYELGLSVPGNLYGTTFFVLTGFHGTHVFIGVVWLTSLVALSLRGMIQQKDSEKVEIAGLYWHFVDIVWILLFTLVYLIPYGPTPQ